MPVPAFDPSRDYRLHRQEYLAACDRVMASGRLILGPETEAFEQEFADFAGAGYGVGCNSGTDALVLAMSALGVRAGDEVLVPALTAPATAVAVRMLGAAPVPVDVLPDALTIDPERAERAVTPRTRCLIAVHLYGRAARLNDLTDVARRHGMWVVEDCAQGHGTKYDGRHVGTFGHVGCFSFYPTKNLGATGDAGMCVTDDPELDARLRRLRHYGLDAEGTAREAGRNSRLDELQAALLRARLPRVQAAVRRRRQLAEEYRRRLRAADVEPPSDDEGHAYHQFVVRTSRRPATIDALAKNRIGYGVHYPKPLHLMPAFARPEIRRGDLPVAERAADEVLSLPMFPELESAEIIEVCSTLARRFPAPSRSAFSTTR
jgi:dTDP-4-amino-4,6-dideoxygalactose transaminase